MRRLTLALLTALAGVLATAGGCVSQDPGRELGRFLREEISDADRSAKLTALVEKRDRDMEAYAVEIGRYRSELERINADYESTSQAFAGPRAEFSKVREAHRAKLISTAMEMRGACTKPEWADLADLDIRAMVASMNKSAMPYVEPEAPADSSVATLQKMEAVLSDLAERLGVRARELTEVHRRYSATEGDYLRVFGGLDEERGRALTQFMRLREELKGTVTREGWKAMYSY